MAPHGAVRPSVRPGPAVAVGRPCPPTWIGSSETVAPTGASMRCSSVIASTAFSSDPARPWHQADVDGGDAGAERLLSSLKSVHRTLDEAVRRTESRLEYPGRLGRTGREPGRIEAQARSCLRISRPHQERREGDGCLMGLGGPAVLGGDAAPLLPAVEAAFNHVAPLAELLVEGWRAEAQERQQERRRRAQDVPDSNRRVVSGTVGRSCHQAKSAAPCKLGCLYD